MARLWGVAWCPAARGFQRGSGWAVVPREVPAGDRCSEIARPRATGGPRGGLVIALPSRELKNKPPPIQPPSRAETRRAHPSRLARALTQSVELRPGARVGHVGGRQPRSPGGGHAVADVAQGV